MDGVEEDVAADVADEAAAGTTAVALMGNNIRPRQNNSTSHPQQQHKVETSHLHQDFKAANSNERAATHPIQ